MPGMQIQIQEVNNLRKLIIIPVILALLVSGLACQPASNTNTGKKSIVVTYSILGSVIKALVGNAIEVTVSVPNGLDPHEWEPSVKDIQTINSAYLVIQNGLGLEGGLEKTLAAAKNRGVNFFTASDHITVRHVGPGEGIPTNDPDQAVGVADPHLWMDPLTLKAIIGPLTVELKKDFNLDFSQTAADLESRLDGLNQKVLDSVAIIPADNRKLITGHESMGYFAQHYNFKLVGVIVPSLSTQAEVSAADLSQLKVAIKENRVKAIFTELGTSPAIAKAIGDETGVRVVEITTHTLPGDGSYFTFLLNLADTITGALK
jgi:zinc/manganese transport system substrate-binding protein